MTDPDTIPGCVFNSRVHDESDTLRGVAGRIASLADSFADTGNEHVADKLYGLAQTVEHSRKAILDAHYRRTSDESGESRRALGQTLVAILAMGNERAAKLDSLVEGK